MPMHTAFINQKLALAAKRALKHMHQPEEALHTLYLQPDRAIFFAENRGIILKVYMDEKTLQREYDSAQRIASVGVPTPTLLGFEAGEPAVLVMKYVRGNPLSSRNTLAANAAGKYLQRIHNIGAQVPFAGGQQQWNEFIAWWSAEEIEKVKRVAVLDHKHLMTFQRYAETLQPLLMQRPIVLLHGDLQPAHILVDPQTEQVLAFLDFADTQAGDPLLDIAIATLWDHGLADLLLEEYSTIENNEETKQLLSFYRLLRQLSEIPWLRERGFKALSERNTRALQDALETLAP